MLMKFKQNRTVGTTKDFEKKKMVNQFRQSVDAILEDASVPETIL